jgi:hypothetical protein
VRRPRPRYVARLLPSDLVKGATGPARPLVLW